MRDATVRRVYLGGEIDSLAKAQRRRRPHKPPLLEVEDVSVLYGKAQALDNVSLHVGEGEFVSIVGLNGAGKTTLFNAMSGLVPYSGTITLRRPGPRAGSRPAASRAPALVQCPEGARTVRRHERARRTSISAASI